MIDRKWMKELGIEITKSIRQYEKYEVPDAGLNSISIVNRTFALDFTRELLADKDINLFVFAERFIPEIEKRLILDAFHLFDDSKQFFKWEKPEGQVTRYFTIEEIEKDLLSNPIKIEKIKNKFKTIPDPLKDQKLIFQERWPWEIRQYFDMDDIHRVRARLAAQIIPKGAKLVEED